MNMTKKGFTLLELMLVVIIVGIIATFAIPGYLGVKQRAEGRQASTQLKLIHTAEKIEFLENDLYVACNNTANCNSSVIGLDLDLPVDNWVYSVACAGGCTNDFKALARNGNGTGPCTYSITKDTLMQKTVGCVYSP